MKDLTKINTIPDYYDEQEAFERNIITQRWISRVKAHQNHEMLKKYIAEVWKPIELKSLFYSRTVEERNAAWKLFYGIDLK